MASTRDRAAFPRLLAALLTLPGMIYWLAVWAGDYLLRFQSAAREGHVVPQVLWGILSALMVSPLKALLVAPVLTLLAIVCVVSAWAQTSARWRFMLIVFVAQSALWRSICFWAGVRCRRQPK